MKRKGKQRQWQRIWAKKIAHPELSNAELGALLKISENRVLAGLRIAHAKNRGESATDLAAQEIAAREGRPQKALLPMPSKRRLERIVKDITASELEKGFTSIAWKAQELALDLLETEGAEFTLKELMVASAIATDKRAILRGEPTAIIEHRDIHRADDVAKALIAELARRGKIPGSVTIQDFVSQPVAMLSEGE